MLFDDKPVYTRVQFQQMVRTMYEHAAYTVDRRSRDAYRLALQYMAFKACEALERDDRRWVRVEWDEDHDTDMSFLKDMSDTELVEWHGAAHTFEQVCVKDNEGTVLWSLSGIIDASPEYRMAIIAEAARELDMLSTFLDGRPIGALVDMRKWVLYSGYTTVHVRACPEITDDDKAVFRLNVRTQGRPLVGVKVYSTWYPMAQHGQLRTGFAPLSVAKVCMVVSDALAMSQLDSHEMPALIPDDACCAFADGSLWVTPDEPDAWLPRHMRGENEGMYAEDNLVHIRPRMLLQYMRNVQSGDIPELPYDTDMFGEILPLDMDVNCESAS